MRNAYTTTGTIGDGPHGSAGDASGDFDFSAVHASAGQQLTVATSGDLDTVVVLYDATGTVVAADDDGGPGLLSLLDFTIPASGDYYLMVAGYGLGTVLPEDPFDSGSGLGAGKEGAYGLSASLVFSDLDFYAVDLVAGDVLGASVTGLGTRLTVRDPGGRVVFGSEQDASFIYAPNAPLPGGGNAVVSYVTPRDGRYTLEVGGSGTGQYDVTVEAYRPGPEALEQGTTQTLFLDFDGARINTAIFGGPGVRTLSPLQGFLGKWGLTAADEDKVIDQVIAAVRENILADAKARGTDPRVGLTILNSRDNPDAFGKPNVHRIVVGGTIAESGIDTIGIAQYIDPGNYATEDTALVLLDVLSDPTGDASLNTYITPASNKIKFIGRALGNVISHEAGHLYGSFHTDPLNATPNLMDAGGAFPGLFGVGPDNIGGTADDVDYDFGEDVYTPDEGLAGVEDTLNTTAWALVKGKAK
ncbi:PPC domain-containing protein [Dactylosporangium darangshiense]|uniref:PPC domain-containing protein n=1 Tax=Dactylosporangium darangshiense TaxID=579108 RepID=UPI0036381DBD